MVNVIAEKPWVLRLKCLLQVRIRLDHENILVTKHLVNNFQSLNTFFDCSNENTYAKSNALGVKLMQILFWSVLISCADQVILVVMISNTWSSQYLVHTFEIQMLRQMMYADVALTLNRLESHCNTFIHSHLHLSHEHEMSSNTFIYLGTSSLTLSFLMSETTQDFKYTMTPTKQYLQLCNSSHL